MLVTSYISLLTDFEDDIRNWWSPGSHLGHVPAWTWQMFAAAKCTTAASSHSPPRLLASCGLQRQPCCGHRFSSWCLCKASQGFLSLSKTALVKCVRIFHFGKLVFSFAWSRTCILHTERPWGWTWPCCGDSANQCTAGYWQTTHTVRTHIARGIFFL